MANVNYNDYDERLLSGGTDTKYEEDPRTEKEPESEEDIYYQLPANLKSRSLKWAVISLVAGILSLVLCPFYYVAGFFFVALGCGATAISRVNLGYFEKTSIIGLILSMIGVVCNTFSVIVQYIYF